MTKDTKQTSLGFPGHHSPGANFDDPIAMLLECHDRVRASLDLLLKINVYLKANGWNTHTARAAADVLRYFDVAAPLHHQDEELHVFPLLRESQFVAIQDHVARVQAEHRQMDYQWSTLRAFLLELTNEKASAKWSHAFDEQARSFQALYNAHLEIEEQLLLPALLTRVTAEELEYMGLEMQQRRRDSAARK